MKRFKKVCLIIGGVLTTAGIVLAAVGYMSGRVSGRWQQPSVSEATRLDAEENCIRLDMDLTCDDVTVLPSDDGMLHIEYARSEDQDYHHAVERDAATGQAVYTFSSSDSGFRLMDIHLLFWEPESRPVTVYLPKGMALSCSTTSGDICAHTLQAGTVSLSTTSGELLLLDLSAESLSCSTTSGSIEVIRGAVSGSVSAGSTSGDIELDDLDAAALSCSTTSGDIDLSCGTIAGKTHLSSISGDIELASTAIQGDLGLSSTSGELVLEPATVYGSIEAESTSGDVHMELTGAPAHRMDALNSFSGGITVRGGDPSGAETISISTTSGEIWVQD